MNDPVRVDKASLDALTETMRAMSMENTALKAEVAALRALLMQHGLSQADEATEPEDAQ